ncbi:glycosyltransferase [Butyrivibrio sp. CB08]|uniref:glycosyltransferase n=1 Tax=Butyrivibrio sp. CB08 TaxID=2364879 RepID=UPI000EA873C2|nr:glycosyltransferase [Butyrivibrio sp. CB08]RKM60412.1 glycosyltransferase [Butyrivibrio sp. CB08]
MINQNKIIIRGTGVRAKNLINELESYKKTVPDVYNEIMQKIFGFIDIDPQKQGTFFYNIPVYGPSILSDFKDTFLYVVAIADCKTILDEIQNDNGSNIRVITDMEFVREIHLDLTSGIYRTCDDELKTIIDDAATIVKNDYDISRIRKCFCDEVDAFAIRMVKALFFLNDRAVLTCNKQITITTSQSEKYCTEPLVIGMFTSTFGGGGTERVVSHLAKSFVEQGMKVFIFVDQNSDQEYAIPENVELVRFKHPLGEDFYNDIEERYQILKEKKINIACFHFPYEGALLYYEALLCKLMGVKTFVEAHTSFINALRQRGGLFENKKIYTLVDKLVVLSKTDELFWRDNGVEAQYIPNPFPIKELGIEIKQEKNVLLWVGKLDQKYKRVFDLIPIVARVKSIIPDVKLYIVGATVDEKEGKYFKQQIAEKKLENNIIFCGFVSDVDSYYQMASVMLMTSPGEGFPMALAEAKTNGLPVVMYDLPYLELVKDGKGVVTVKQGDIKSFADEVVSLLTDDDRREELSKQARKSAEYFMNYNIVGAWKNVFEGISDEEIVSEAQDQERALIWKLLDESMKVTNDKRKLDELREIDLEDRRRLQKNFGFIDWHLTPKLDKPYIDAIVDAIVDQTKDRSYRSIVEIGCGLGDIIGDSLLEGYSRKAYDLSSEVICAARERFMKRGVEWYVGSFNDVKDRDIEFLIAVNFIHSIKPEYLLEYFNNLYSRNKIKYLIVDKVTGNYPYTHDFESLLPEYVHEIKRFGPYYADGGERYILLWENMTYGSD